MKKILVPLFSVLMLLIIALAAMQITDRDCERATGSVRAKFASFLEIGTGLTDGIGVQWTPVGCTVTKDTSWWFVAPWGGIVAWKTFQPSETEEPVPGTEEPVATFVGSMDKYDVAAIRESLALPQAVLTHIARPDNWVLPEGVESIQVQDGFMFGDSTGFAFVKQSSFNQPLFQDDGTVFRGPYAFRGVLFTRDAGQTWTNSFETPIVTDENVVAVDFNPVGMWIENGTMFLDLESGSGAGSGEGTLIRYSSQDGETWAREEGCYYFIPEPYYAFDPNSGIVGKNVYATMSVHPDALKSTACPAYVSSIDQAKEQTIETQYFTLRVSGGYDVEISENYIRIQNFIGQDDPNYDYPDDAFYIEIEPMNALTMYGLDEAAAIEEWTQNYDSAEDAILNGKTVRLLEGRHPGGDGWPGLSYIIPGEAVISVSAQTDSPTDPGLVLAKDLISVIVWNDTPWSVYQDPNGRFSFDYPSVMQNTQTQDPYYRLHNIVVTMTSAISDYSPMNYSQNEWFSVSSEAVEEKTCFAHPDTGTAAFLERTTLNGIEFRVERSEDAGAGNRYEQTLYRTYRDNTCYEVATMLHYSSDWTDVDQAAMDRNQTKARFILREMAGSFAFVQ